MERLNAANNEKLSKIVSTLKSGVEDRLEREKIQQIIADEWVDPSPDFVEGIFSLNPVIFFMRSCKKSEVNKAVPKTVVYDYRSLFCLHYKNPLRVELVNFTCSNMFENFVILLIFLNSIVLAMYDYDDRDNLTEWN